MSTFLPVSSTASSPMPSWSRYSAQVFPFLCASATMDSVTARRLSVVFRLAPPQSYGWSVYADCLVSHGFQHVVALQEDNLYWNGGSRVIEARLHNLGVRFTRLPLTSGPTDVAACIRQVRGMRSEHPAPDILLMLVAYPEPFVSLAREASEHGLVAARVLPRRSRRARRVPGPMGRCRHRRDTSTIPLVHAVEASHGRRAMHIEGIQGVGLGVNRLLSRTKDTTAFLSSLALAPMQGPLTPEPCVPRYGKSRYSARAAPLSSRRSRMAWCINSGNGRRCASSPMLDRNKLLRKPTCYGTRSMATQVEGVFGVRLANPSLQPTRYGRWPPRAVELKRVRRAWRVTSSVKVRWPGSAEPKARRRARASSRGGV